MAEREKEAGGGNGQSQSQSQNPIAALKETRVRETVARSSCLDGYVPSPGIFDEAALPGGELRPHFAGFARALAELHPEEQRRRWDSCNRLVHEQGIEYNVYGDPRGMERPWQLDPVPLVIEEEEWGRIEKALIQRAVLLDQVLCDCYGPQELVRSGWLPPALVFGQPDFLRACHGTIPGGGRMLHLYAADLARSPDGQWWVISDRTQIPTGAGYALANRLVTSRVLPEAFRDCHVQRLARFFREMQASLGGLAGRRADSPRVVLLTPGPYNETYFEQGYLARYLGYSMVEGQDLTVRDDRVFLKTLSGLEPVDVILRRVDDDFCDPLELRNDSMLGVPGLIEAVRAGNVVMANALGSSLVQSPAFHAFLPGLSRHLLGEELLMPSVATWWCGQKNAAKHVLENLESIFVKPAFRSRLKGSEPGRELSKTELEALRRRIEFEPQNWVAQERVELSTAPAVSGARIVPSHVALRVFLVSKGDGYAVMPGGLTRVARDETTRSISMQRGGTSKDTWVVSSGPVEDVTLLRRGDQAVELRRVGNNLPSRLADNFFWMGRYAERVGGTARILRSSLLRVAPEPSGGAMVVLGPLVESLEEFGVLAPHDRGPRAGRNPESLEAELLSAVFDASRPGSLRATTARLDRVGMRVRDRTSNDLWRAINRLEETLNSPGAGKGMLAGDAAGLLNDLLLHVAAFHGLARENMTRAQGWRFLDMGCRIERAAYLCALIEAVLRSPDASNPSVLEALLEVADSTITYRSRYSLLPDLTAVYDLLVLDDTNPRSLLFQFNQLLKHFERLPRERESALPSEGQRILIESVARLRLLDPRELSGMKGGWRETAAAGAVRQGLRDLPALSLAISASYFAHSSILRAGAGGNA